MAKTKLIDERISAKQCKLAVEALLAYELKNEQKHQEKELLPRKEPNLWLNVTVKKIPPGHTFKPKRIPIAYPLIDPRTTSICLITKDPQREYKDLLEARNIKFISRVVGIKKLKGKFKPFEARRMLLKENGLFLADDRIIPILPKLLGVKWFEAKKQPIPVSLKQKDLKAELERAVSSTYMHQNKGTCTSIKVATLSQSPAHILENLTMALPAIAKNVYGGWENIQSLHVKTNSSVSLPIWSCALDDSEAGRWTGLTANAGEEAHPDMDEDTQTDTDSVGTPEKSKKRTRTDPDMGKMSKKAKGEEKAKKVGPTSVATEDSDDGSEKVMATSTGTSPRNKLARTDLYTGKTGKKAKGEEKAKKNRPTAPATGDSNNGSEKVVATSTGTLSSKELRRKRDNAPGEKKKSKVTLAAGKSSKNSILGRKAGQA